MSQPLDPEVVSRAAGRDAGEEQRPGRADLRRRRGFTLLEILVAVTLLATAFTIIWSTFSTTLDGWRRSGEFLDRITHGDFVIDQMVSSLRSAAFFPNRPDKYGFWLESRGGGDSPRDSISWVASGTAFMLPEDPLSLGLYRIMLDVESGGDGGLAVRSFHHLADEIEKNDVEPWIVSSRVRGLDCRIYNFEEEIWEDEWENTNEIPTLIEITLFLEPIEKYERPVKVQRIIQIPVAPAVKGAVRVEEPAPEPQVGKEDVDQAGGSQPAGTADGKAASPGADVQLKLPGREDRE